MKQGAMIFLSLLILIVAIALPSINQNIRSILYVRISSIIFIYAGALALNAFYVQSIGSVIGVYSGLFQFPFILPSLDELDYNILMFSSFFKKNNNSNNKKTLLSLIWTGVKEVFRFPELPEHISKLDKCLPVKLFKLIGWTCLIIALSGITSNWIKIYFLSVYTIAISFLIYRLIISVYALKQWVQNIKEGK